jgi:GT2 family glycosyltransferase
VPATRSIGATKWAYVMDVDFSFEARLRGFRLFQVPVSLQHEESRSTRAMWEQQSELKDYISHNLDRFYEKWAPAGSSTRSYKRW